MSEITWTAASAVPPEEELRQLRSQLRDLVALMTLPAMWRGGKGDATQIVESLADVLVHLLRLDFAWIRLDESVTRTVVEALRPHTDTRSAEQLHPIRATLQGNGDTMVVNDAEGAMCVVRIRPRVDTEHWFVAVGSRRPTFPDDTERFLLRVAVEQAAIATESLRLYWEARQASEAKSAFMAVMSHELRTPLNGILGYIDLLLMGVPKEVPPESRVQIERVRASTYHLLQIIEEILTFSRLDAGQVDLHVEEIEVAALIRDTAELVEPLASGKRLRLELALPDEHLRIRTDGPKLRQVLLNLLSNAIKFTDAGEVRLDAEVVDGALLLRVEDTGIGIPADEVERIFEPFRQVDQNLSRKRGGTGLGLSVARQLTGLLGGSVSVESAPAVGSTFTIRLPLSAGSDGRSLPLIRSGTLRKAPAT